MRFGKLHAESEGTLPRLDPAAIKKLTLACGHTSSGLGCIGDAVKTHNEELMNKKCSSEGCMSLAKLREQSPDHAKAVEEGIRYKVIRWQLNAKCPRLASLCQEAYNIGQSIAQQETCFQVVRKIYTEASKYQEVGKPIPWDAIKARVASTRPLHATHVEGYVKFVKEHVDRKGVL